MLNKILLTYDCSEDNEKDLEWGLNFIKRRPVKTVIVKLIEPLNEIGDQPSAAGMASAIRQNSEVMLEKVTEMFGNVELSATTTILVGDPDSELAQCAEKEEVDLIICGTRGLGWSSLSDQGRRGIVAAGTRCNLPEQFLVYSLRAVLAS